MNQMWMLRVTLVPPAWAGPEAVCHVLVPTRFARRAEAALAGQCLWAGPPGKEIEALHVRPVGDVAGGDPDGDDVGEQGSGWEEVPWDHTCGAILLPDQGDSGGDGTAASTDDGTDTDTDTDTGTNTLSPRSGD